MKLCLAAIVLLGALGLAAAQGAIPADQDYVSGRHLLQIGGKGLFTQPTYPTMPTMPSMGKGGMPSMGKGEMPSMGKGAGMVRQETIEYVDTTEYQDQVVTKQEIVNTPRMTTETQMVKKPRVVMKTELVKMPKTTYKTETILETKQVTTPVFSMQPTLFNKPDWSLTFGKGKGFIPRISGDFAKTPTMIMKPSLTTQTDYITVPKKVKTPQMTVEEVPVLKQEVVMEEVAIQVPKMVMEQRMVEKQYLVKQPVVVKKPVTRVSYVQQPMGKGATPPMMMGKGAMPPMMSEGKGAMGQYMPQMQGSNLIPLPSGGGAGGGATATIVTGGGGGMAAQMAGAGAGAGAGGAVVGGTVVNSQTVITGPDGRTIDISTLKAGDVLPAGSTVSGDNGGGGGGGGGGAPTVNESAAVDSADGGAAAGGAGAGGARAPFSLITSADGTISVVPGGAQGGSGSPASFSALNQIPFTPGQATNYVSGIGPFPSTPGTINGFGLTNAGFPVVGNTPVAFLPKDRADQFPNANTTINWPCGDKPAGTEFVKGLPCGQDMVAVPTAALPEDTVAQLHGNWGSGLSNPVPGSGPARAPAASAAAGPAAAGGAKEAALKQTAEQKLFAFMKQG